MSEPVHWGGPCSLCGNPHHDGPTYEMSAEDEAYQRRVCAMLNENPGLAPRHALMFVDFDKDREAMREAALEWEREKGRAYAEGFRRAGETLEEGLA